MAKGRDGSPGRGARDSRRVAPDGGSKWQKILTKMRTRVVSSVVMAVGLALTVYGGHVFLWVMLLAFQVIIAREIFEVQRTKSAADYKPSFWWHQWLFFWTAAFYLYGRYIRRNLMVEVVVLNSDWLLTHVIKLALKYHALMSFMAYIAGVISFVLHLEPGQSMGDFMNFAWTHMVLLCTFIPSSLIVSSLFEGGIVWFLLPAILIMINDTFAYFFGVLWGRTPLIKLSPSKTWEGFVGGALSTVAVSWFLSKWLSQYDWLVCPRDDLTVFGPLHCTRSLIYQPILVTAKDVVHYIPLTRDIAALFGKLMPTWLSARAMSLSATIVPIQLHAVAVSLFASLIAPFGGFFASGFKRAFGVKDFGDSIPGHGGMTDRMDCQIIMGIFVHVYLKTFVLLPNVNRLFDTFVMLDSAEQVSFLKFVAVHIERQGLIRPELRAQIMQVPQP